MNSVESNKVKLTKEEKMLFQNYYLKNNLNFISLFYLSFKYNIFYLEKI